MLPLAKAELKQRALELQGLMIDVGLPPASAKYIEHELPGEDSILLIADEQRADHVEIRQRDGAVFGARPKMRGRELVHLSDDIRKAVMWLVLRKLNRDGLSNEQHKQLIDFRGGCTCAVSHSPCHACSSYLTFAEALELELIPDLINN